MTDLPEIYIELAAGGLEALEVPGISAGKLALTQYVKRRREQAREILFEEIAEGRGKPVDLFSDEAVAVTMRYVRAASEGKARINLRLLAKAIAGQLRHGNLVADEFFLYADALADLTRDEIHLLAIMYRMHIRFEEHPPADGGAGFWNACIVESVLTLHGTEDQVRETAGSCLRSAFVIAVSAWDNLAFRLSPRFLALAKTVDFADAILREASGGKDD